MDTQERFPNFKLGFKRGVKYANEAVADPSALSIGHTAFTVQAELKRLGDREDWYARGMRAALNVSLGILAENRAAPNRATVTAKLKELENNITEHYNDVSSGETKGVAA